MKISLSFILLISFFITKAQQETLDSGFANNGVLINQNSSLFDDFGLQSNGEIIVAGPQWKTPNSLNDFVITRYTGNGSLDTGFGNRGYAGDTGIASRVDNIAIQKDDGIVAAGRTAYGLKIERFTKNGEVDKSFGNNGVVIINIGLNALSYTRKVILQPDGKILIGGYTVLANQTRVGFILRYLTNGFADSSFGNNGVVSWQAPGRGTTFDVTSIAMQGSGQILVHWYYEENDVVNRYNPSGIKDLGFGVNGDAHFQTTDNIADQFYPYNLIVQADDKIIASGYASRSTTGRLFFAAGRLNKNGKIDAGYGNDGLQHIAFSQPVVSTSFGMLQTDGKLILAGNVEGSKDNYAMTRLTTTGIVDSVFGQNGQVITEFEKNSTCQGILLQDDNKILLGGYLGIALSPNFLIVRYNNNLSTERISNTRSLNQADELKIKLSSNPVINNLQVSGLPSGQKIKISVIDFSGNVKMQVITNSNNYSLNTLSLKPGNYLLKIEINNSVFTRAFIKE